MSDQQLSKIFEPDRPLARSPIPLRTQDAPGAARPSGVLIAAVLVVNVFSLLFPVQLDGAAEVAEVLRLMSSYGTPVLLLLAVLLEFNGRAIAGHEPIVAATGLASFGFLVAVIANGIELKGVATSLFFAIASLSIFVVQGNQSQQAVRVIGPLSVALAVWTLLPIVMLLHPDLRATFLNHLDRSFRGFADSRIGYGFWSSTLVILLFGLLREEVGHHRYFLTSHRRWWWGCALLATAFGGIYLSQSRSAVVGLALAATYFVGISRAGVGRKIGQVTIVMVLALSVMGSWKLFGRQEPLSLHDPTRIQIASEYYKEFLSGNVYLGRGSQVSVKSPSQDFGAGRVSADSVTQAHNLILQWLANYGVVGVLLLVVFLGAVWHRLRSSWARMLFLLFMTFSLTQPIQGTANFFSPMTLVIFFLLVGMDLQATRSPAHRSRQERW
jgi:hypothetical protein